MSWWFKRHPDLLERECQFLGSNSNYKEFARKRGNILVSSGEIVVRLDNVSRHPIAIIYPESTPYRLPKIVFLEQCLSSDQVESISKESSYLAIASLQDNVKFYNRWHQNADGTLCLLEEDNLEKFGEFFTIHDVINRTREWLAGLITGNLPPDCPEVELFAHFRAKDRDREIIIPDPFLSANIRQGEFYCIMVSRVYRGTDKERKIYMGSLLQGENQRGVRVDPVGYQNNLQFMPLGIVTPLDIQTKPDVILKAIEDESMLVGFWWDTVAQIEPIQNMSGFAEMVGDGSIENGFKRIHHIIGNRINNLPQRIYLGLRFQNKRGNHQWQIFVLNKGFVVSPQILLSENIKDFIDLFDNYALLAIRCEEMNEKKYHSRNGGIVNREILKGKDVNIIGCGAMGGEVADIIGKAGIGKITLVDNQRINLENCIRHVIGAESIGLAKVHALHLHILHHNPFVETIPVATDVMDEDINAYFQSGIGVSTIANDNVEEYINEQAIINDKVIFYGRALRGGKAARIFRVKPGEDACFYCLSLYANEENAVFTSIPSDSDLPTITNECNNPIRPGSAADLKLIASLVSRIVIDYLQTGGGDDNHWIWSTEVIEGISTDRITPYSLTASSIPPHPECHYCKPFEHMSVELDTATLKFMRAETLVEPNLETGGVLLGEIENGILTIRHASGPGPNAIKERTKFLKDKEYCQAFINEMFEQQGNKASYIGEWHYHPSGNNKPSNTDLGSLSNIANKEGYLTESPVMIILSSIGEPSTTVHPFSNTYYFADVNLN